VIRNYIASKLGAPTADGRSLKQLVNTLADTLPDDDGLVYRAHMTTKDAANRILEYARVHLPEEQIRALDGWLQGKDFEELAADLGLGDARSADRIVRAALARLRRQFAAE
jgi:hypothetical protein